MVTSFKVSFLVTIMFVLTICSNHDTIIFVEGFLVQIQNRHRSSPLRNPTTSLTSEFYSVSSSTKEITASLDQVQDDGGTTLRPQWPTCLSPELINAMKNELQIASPNPIQLEALNSLLADNDDDVTKTTTEATATTTTTIIIAQTGSGKTITFLLPILQHLQQANVNSQASRYCLIVAPNELLLQQHQNVAKKLDEENSHRIVYMTPDMFLQQKEESDLSSSYHIVVLDEVDAMLYRNNDNDGELTTQGKEIINKLRHPRLPSPPLPPQTTTINNGGCQLILTSAYLSPSHERSLLERDFVTSSSSNMKVNIIRDDAQGKKGWMVPTLRHVYRYFSSSSANKLNQLQKVLEESKSDSLFKKGDGGGSTIIFCATTQIATTVYDFILANCSDKDEEVDDATKSHTKILLLHDDLNIDERKHVLEQLTGDPSSRSSRLLFTILICTDIASRGLDIPNMKHVILFDVPNNVSEFVHQAGRTARKGQKGLLSCLIQTQSNQFGRYKTLHALKDASKLY